MREGRAMNETAVTKKADQADKDKAAAGEIMPPPKEKSDDPADDTAAGRIARRGQDPPEPEDSRDPGSGIRSSRS